MASLAFDRFLAVSLIDLIASALYYISPLFPYDARVHFQLLQVPSESSRSNHSEADQALGHIVVFNQTLFLSDNSTERVTDRSEVDSIGPTKIQTFTISEDLEVNGKYTAIVSSDFEDGTTWTWIGRFV